MSITGGWVVRRRRGAIYGWKGRCGWLLVHFNGLDLCGLVLGLCAAPGPHSLLASVALLIHRACSCIIDTRPRKFDAESCSVLANMAEMVVREIEKEKALAAQVGVG